MGSITNIIALRLFVLLLGVICADTFVGRLPTAVSTAAQSEEIWIYLCPSFPYLPSFFLFYQKDASQLELTSTDAFLSLFYVDYSGTAVVTKTLDPSLTGVVRLGRWIHIAVAETLLATEAEATLYVDGAESETKTGTTENGVAFGRV